MYPPQGLKVGEFTITGGTIAGVTMTGDDISGCDVTVGAGKTLDVSAGTLTLADNQISGDKVEGGTIASITIAALASSGITGGSILGNLVPINSAGGITLTTAQVAGQLVYVSSTGTVVLPAVTGANGWSVLVYCGVAAAVHVDPNGSDRIILDGVALDNGDKASSTSNIGDTLWLINNDADGWIAFSGKNAFTDGG